MTFRQHFKLELLETALELNETRDTMETLSSKLQATELQLHSYRLQLKRGKCARAHRAAEICGAPSHEISVRSFP